MMREDEVRALMKVAAGMAPALREVGSPLADALIASSMGRFEIGQLLLAVAAYCDADVLYDGIMPEMPLLDAPGIPAAVRVAAGDVVRRAYANANMHRRPHGQQPS